MRPWSGRDAAFSAASYRFDVVRGRGVLRPGRRRGRRRRDHRHRRLRPQRHPRPPPTSTPTRASSPWPRRSSCPPRRGAGERTGEIGTIGDTDLFFFATIADASTTPATHTVRVDASGQSVTPVLRVFDAGTSLLATIVDNGAGDLDPAAGIVEYDVTAHGRARPGVLPAGGDRRLEHVPHRQLHHRSWRGRSPTSPPAPGDDHANRGPVQPGPRSSAWTRAPAMPRSPAASIPRPTATLFRIDPAATGPGLRAGWSRPPARCWTWT
ncbi:MAG: hypothetical protein KatS3mg103_0586 [Phycisphaerales bacterium]|nr:MAG: hypothetical protein KatS3mg103_0586 [Phycisphaerales bacterium]